MRVVISPNQVKNLRGGYGSAANKGDRFGAFILAGDVEQFPVRKPGAQLGYAGRVACSCQITLLGRKRLGDLRGELPGRCR